jgi:hypothetical protein
MATFPCAQHGARYRGPQQTAYNALLGRDIELRERRRLCPDCMAELRAFCDNNLLDVDTMTGDETLHDCPCGRPATVRAFATVYESGEPRRDFTGAFCSVCATSKAGMALLGAQTRLEGL